LFELGSSKDIVYQLEYVSHSTPKLGMHLDRDRGPAWEDVGKAIDSKE
jgi:hypothetical protein